MVFAARNQRPKVRKLEEASWSFWLISFFLFIFPFETTTTKSKYVRLFRFMIIFCLTIKRNFKFSFSRLSFGCCCCCCCFFLFDGRTFWFDIDMKTHQHILPIIGIGSIKYFEEREAKLIQNQTLNDLWIILFGRQRNDIDSFVLGCF